ncbi:hypothetical protein [Paracoccus sp. MKU1]|uniref:hypothetical protein n=1 Tax=Paracoccus sp. MKU1 TaxID=1745182 RepID=UPI0007193351|nr:hypothetical protein [Paracoccus sp. MKU1]KRW94341.1 hypothetical protein AQY21_20645 [Paracoccus sp. MKU1]
MTDKNDRLRTRVENALEHEPIYRGIYGRKRLTDLLPTGVGLKDILPRLLVLVTGPYRDRVEVLEADKKTSAAEKRALTRKTEQTPDVVIYEDLTLAEVQDMLRLRDEGLTQTRIATLFDVPTATVKHIFSAMDGKLSSRVVYNAEMRRRRKATLRRPTTTGARAIEIEDTPPEPEVEAIKAAE